MDTKELIDQMITDILAGNNVEAKDIFDQAIGLKVSDALDVKKVEVAQAIYARDDEEEEDQPEEEDEDVSETEE
jgi:protein tyrosine phosphatase (PTP) superfamily phosphohydrolase (DUF442 family)